MSADVTVTVAPLIPHSVTCGAYVAPGVWKEFDCYNLAAIGKVTGADPFTPSWELIGGYWQWGRKGPDPDKEDWYNTNTPHFTHGPTGPGVSEANGGSIKWWNSSHAPSGAWSDGPKTANDPCPAGFRVPTSVQWQGVLDNNNQSSFGTWSSYSGDPVNYSAAWFFGNLMLPATGGRFHNSGELYGRGSSGLYWSSSEFNSSSATHLYFRSGFANMNTHYSTRSYSVRCIAE